MDLSFKKVFPSVSHSPSRRNAKVFFSQTSRKDRKRKRERNAKHLLLRNAKGGGGENCPKSLLDLNFPKNIISFQKSNYKLIPSN